MHQPSHFGSGLGSGNDLKQSSFWHPYTPIPHLGPRATFTRASGSYVYDDAGNRLFDATSSWWCQIHGHCHPRLVKALGDQAQKLDQILASPHTHPVAEELCDLLVQTAGAPFSKVFLSDNGSTAVEVALKMALQYWQLKGEPKRKKFLSLDMGYHGDTFGAMSVACPPDFVWAFSKLDQWAVQAPTPYAYRPQPEFREQDALSYADFCADRAIALLEKNKTELAAVVLEPLVMGAGGLIVYPSHYLQRVTAAAQALGILVIFDEVFTGFGRTGTMFAFEQISARPDMVCLSKGITSGMLPMAATLTTEQVFSPFIGGEERRLAHGHTFTANALSAAVALESLKIFHQDRVIERNQELIGVFASHKARFEQAPHVGEVRHLGMIFVLELVKDKATKQTFEPANSYGWMLAEKLWEKGVWVRPLRQVMYVIPPYCTTKGDLQETLSKLEQVLYE